jgi:hypothetical protein
MSKLRLVAVSALAAATMAVGGLATAPPAHAALSCETALAVSSYYISLGQLELERGNYTSAQRWFAKAEGVLIGAC